MLSQRLTLVPFPEDSRAGMPHDRESDDAMASVGADPESGKTADSTEDTMRWEDDGGPAADTGGPGSQGTPARVRSAKTKESVV